MVFRFVRRVFKSAHLVCVIIRYHRIILLRQLACLCILSLSRPALSGYPVRHFSPAVRSGCPGLLAITITLYAIVWLNRPPAGILYRVFAFLPCYCLDSYGRCVCDDDTYGVGRGRAIRRRFLHRVSKSSTAIME